MGSDLVDLDQRRQHRLQRQPSISAREFRSVAGLFVTGVTVVTTRRDDEGRGMTVNAFTSVSLDPLLILVCIRKDSEMHRLIQEIGTFAISVLGVRQRRVAAWFANPARPHGPEQFAAVPHRAGRRTGAPLIAGALAWMECAVTELVEAGDHTIVLGRVLDLGRPDATEPLVFFAGAYGSVSIDSTDDPAVAES